MFTDLSFVEFKLKTIECCERWVQSYGISTIFLKTFIVVTPKISQELYFLVLPLKFYYYPKQYFYGTDWNNYYCFFLKMQTESWEQAKQNKEDRKLKRKKRKEWKAQNSTEGGKKKKRKAVTQEELNELAADIALMKKLKKRKITQDQFDKQFET